MRGAIHKQVFQLLAKVGFEISKEMMESGCNQGSGHDNLRYVVNSLISECINRIMDIIFLDINVLGDKIYWIDVGSKFKVMQTIILRFFEKTY